MAAFAAELATLGSTMDAKKATVDMTGFPAWLKGIGWCANGPADKKRIKKGCTVLHETEK